MAKKTVKGTKPYTGTAKADKITVIGKKNKVSGAGGNDTITVKRGSKHTIYGAAGNDKIYIKGSSKSSHIYGDDAKGKVSGKDTITISGGKKNTINGGKGNDKIIVSKGSGHKIYGAAGNDIIYIKGSTASSKIYGDDAKGKIAGKDKITISGGKKNTIYGGKGTDTITVNGGSSTINGGKGNDVFVIGKDSTGKAVVKDFRTQSGNFDKVKVSSGEVKNIKYSGSNVIITGGKSGSLTLTGAKNRSVYITETNGEYSVTPTTGITMKLKKNYTGSYTAPSFVDNIDVRSVNSEIPTVRGNDKNNRIYVAGVDGGGYQGGAGDDTITATSGNNHRIYGEDESGSSKGNDIITVTGGNGHTIWGQYGNDTITVSGGTKHSINGQDGNDEISVTDGHSHSIKGEQGNDYIVVNNVKGNGKVSGSSQVTSVLGGSGDDTITVNNSSDFSIYGESGADTITVKNSRYLYVEPYLGGGSVAVESCQNTEVALSSTPENSMNRVTVSGKNNDVVIKMVLKAKDSIAVNWEKDFGYLQINAATSDKNTYGTKYVDSLTINKSISNFSFNISGSYDLSIKGKNGYGGGSILIKGFVNQDNMSFIGGINFNGTLYKYDDIKHRAGWK